MSNTNLTQPLIKNILKSIYIGGLDKNIVEAQMLSAILIKDKDLNLVIEFPEELVIDQQGAIEQINNILRREFLELKEIKIIFSSLKREVKPAVKARVKSHIPNVKKIILLASAKGGVGKSTTATNIALALTESGKSVGLVDADIYGPTVPKLLGINKKPEISEGKMLPILQRGIYSMSIGYLVDEDKAAIWRGPMISKTLYQLLVGVKWPELDYLIIDMPPGTGDIYLSLSENFIIDGALLVTTPQQISLSILKKSIGFFNKTNIPIIGVVENMSHFIDENKEIHYIFGPSSLDQLDIDVLGKIPLMPKISQFSDKGLSLANEDEFKIYAEIAEKIDKWCRMSVSN
jgi:ATP-binding protein involved in chromosome partitioning